MNRQACYNRWTMIAQDTDSDFPGPTLGEISAQIERRLAWYGPSAMTLDAVFLKGGKTVIMHLRDATNTIYCEVIDVRIGSVVKREMLQGEFAGGYVKPSPPLQRALLVA